MVIVMTLISIAISDVSFSSKTTKTQQSRPFGTLSLKQQLAGGIMREGPMESDGFLAHTSDKQLPSSTNATAQAKVPRLQCMDCTRLGVAMRDLMF